VSLAYVIDEQQQCVFIHLSGVIGAWELGTTAQQLWAEPAFDPRFARLIDLSQLTELRAGTSLLRAIASDVRAKSPSKVALAAHSETVLADIKLYAESLDGVPVSIFHSVAEAIAWLGVHLPTHWPPRENA
jgi:hypothetical protein